MSGAALAALRGACRLDLMDRMPMIKLKFWTLLRRQLSQTSIINKFELMNKLPIYIAL